jgi:hypothetical protein
MSGDTNRRRFLTGIGAVGATVGLAGCASLPGFGPDVGMEYGDDVNDEITEDSPEDPVYGDLAEPHRFEGSANDDIVVSMTSEDFDTYLVLTDSDEEMVAENDDGGRLFNSELETELNADGVYTIWAGSFSGRGTGDYELELEEA